MHARSHTVNHIRMHTHKPAQLVKKIRNIFFPPLSTTKSFMDVDTKNNRDWGLHKQMDHGELVGLGVGVKQYPDLFFSDVVVVVV